MNRWICHTALMVSVFCTLAMKPHECSAGPLLDWLSGRTPYYQHQPWHIDHGYPRTVPQYPQATYARQPAAAYPTGVAYQLPTAIQTTPGYQGAAAIQQTPDFQMTPIIQSATAIPQATYPQRSVPNSGWGFCGINSLWCAPQTAYRSTWVRVPVTRYRPVHGAASTAYGVPATQACRGYEWRLRRVPVTTFRPSANCWDRFFGPRQSVSYFGTQAAAPCVTYGTAIPQTVPQGSPYYPAQTGAALGTTSIVPSWGLGTGPLDTAPFNSTPANPSTGNGDVPADRAPSLSPSGIPNNTRSMIFPAPSNTVPQATVKTNLDERTNDGQPAPQTPSNNFFNVKPIRDPESKSGRGVVDEVPQLLGPSNHTARNDPSGQVRAWQVVPIQWESIERRDSPQRNAPPRPTTSPSTAPRPARQNWDDSGWHSAW